MRRALTVLAGAVLALLPLGVAQAQTPLPTTIDVVNECGLVTLTFTGPVTGIPMSSNGISSPST